MKPICSYCGQGLGAERPCAMCNGVVVRDDGAIVYDAKCKAPSVTFEMKVPSPSPDNASAPARPIDQLLERVRERSSLPYLGGVRVTPELVDKWRDELEKELAAVREHVEQVMFGPNPPNIEELADRLIELHKARDEGAEEELIAAANLACREGRKVGFPMPTTHAGLLEFLYQASERGLVEPSVAGRILSLPLDEAQAELRKVIDSDEPSICAHPDESIKNLPEDTMRCDCGLTLDGEVLALFGGRGPKTVREAFRKAAWSRSRDEAWTRQLEGRRS